MHTREMEGRRDVSVVRIVLFGVLMTGLVAFELYLHHAVIPELLTRLEVDGHKNSVWIGQQLSYMLPFLTVALFQYFVYRRAERNSMAPGAICPAVRSIQREKAWEILLTAMLVYGVLLPWCIHLSNTGYEAALMEALASGAQVPQTAGNADDKLIYYLAEWFIRLSIPLALLGLYHVARAGEPDGEPADAEEACAG